MTVVVSRPPDRAFTDFELLQPRGKTNLQVLGDISTKLELSTTVHCRPTCMVHSVRLPQFPHVQTNNLEQTSTGSAKHRH